MINALCRSMALTLVASMACASAIAADAPATTERMLVFHAWTQPSETAALKALVDRFSAKYPEASTSAQLVPSGGIDQKSLFPIVRKLVVAQRAPEAFQTHPGYATQPFLDDGLVSPIDGLWESEGLAKVIPSTIRDMTSLNGHYYSVPVGVHRMNVVWYNKALLDRNGIDPATLTSWDAFFKAADQLRASGVASPVQMGPAWTGSLAFQGIMASVGVDAYEDWINGKITTADDPRIQRALETFDRYLKYVNPDHANLPWEKALQRVIVGEAAFCLMGDWSDGEFRQAGKKYGKDYGSIPVPGTKGVYGVAIDTFLQLRGVSSATNSDRWLKLVASREAQDAFNVLKGSISPRGDAEAARYDLYQRSAILDLKNARHIYPSAEEAMPAGYRTSIDDILAGFAVDRDAKKAASRLAQTTERLAGKFTRSWSLK